MATNQEIQTALGQLREMLEAETARSAARDERLSNLETSLRDNANSDADAKSLAQTAIDTVAETEARVTELAAAVGADGGGLASKDEVQEIRQQIIQLNDRVVTTVRLPGAGGSVDFSEPREGFPEGLLAFIINSNYGAAYIRWLTARPLEKAPDAE